MKAILTKYLPATNTKPARIKASFGDLSITLSREYELNIDTDYERVAQELLNSLNIKDVTFVSGELPNGDNCHVLINKKDLSWSRL